MKSIAFFNNKGGVGKTTLCANLGAFFALSSHKRVLLVDCDPQCNSTQLVLGAEVCEDLYYRDQTAPMAETILKVLKPILDGDSSIDSSIKPFGANSNRFRIDLIPGHPEMSMLEDTLSDAWGKLNAGEVEGFRRSHWATMLLRGLNDYDLVLFDVGPSLGSLNRSVLMGSGAFATPMGCDIFSIVGIRNIANWLTGWLDSYKAGYTLCDKKRPGSLAAFQIARNLPIEHGFAGFTVQQYITKSRRGERRPTLAYEAIMQQIPGEIQQNLGRYLCPGVTDGGAKLGDVPHMYSLVPLAQNANAPIAHLTSNDGLVGTQYNQAREYGALISSVGTRLAHNLGMR